MIQSSEALVLTPGDLAEIERLALRRPNKEGRMVPQVIRLFLEHMSKIYGIDMQIETEEMRNERTKREAKEARKRIGGTGKLGRRKSGRSADDF